MEKPKSGDEIIEMIKSLQERLPSATSVSRVKLIVSEIKSLLLALEKAPISPTPKRDYVAGPIKFREFGQHFYDFGFETLHDKHWREGWEAAYGLGFALFAPEVGIVLDLCDLLLSTEREEREETAQDILRDEVLEEVSEYGTDVGKLMIRKGAAKGFAKGVAGLINKLGDAVSVLSAANDLYKANTEGPSPHEAAVETTAMIMAKVYGNRPGGRGGGFIPTPTSSYCRVAREQPGPFLRTQRPQAGLRPDG